MYKCSFCNKKFQSGLSLGGHLAGHKRTGRKYPNKQRPILEVSCIVCKTLFTQGRYKTKTCSRTCASKQSWITKRLLKPKLIFGKTEEFISEYRKNNSKCEICGKSEDLTGANKKKRLLALDHDHDTGKFRGILCFICNTRYEWYIENKSMIEEYFTGR